MSKSISTSGKLELSQIAERIDSGEIYVNQDYQREFVYSKTSQSRLIESFLLGIPIPEIFLCEIGATGKDEVIDGQQRVTSIHAYLTNKFSLTGLNVLTDLEGKRFRDLPQEIQRILRKRQLNFIRINHNNEKLKYEIFTRLNQGSRKLSGQEIRNCIYHGNCNDMLVRLAKEPLTAKLFRDKNTQYRYQDRICSFFAMQRYYNLPCSTRPQMMNKFMGENQDADETAIADMEKKFRDIMQLCDTLFGDDAFYLPDTPRNKPFNRAIFEGIAIGLAQFPKQDILVHKDAISAAVTNMKLRNVDFRKLVESKGASKGRISARVIMVVNTVQEALDKAKLAVA